MCSASGKCCGEAAGHGEGGETHLLLTSRGEQSEWEGPV